MVVAEVSYFNILYYILLMSRQFILQVSLHWLQNLDVSGQAKQPFVHAGELLVAANHVQSMTNTRQKTANACNLFKQVLAEGLV